MAKKLTDALVKKIAVPKDGPSVVWDALATGFGLKVTPKGKRLFVLQTKFPGHATQTTRTLGAYPGLTLEAARAKAQAWYGLAKAGIDPAVEEQKKADAERRAAMLADQRSFGAVATAYIERGLRGQRWAARVQRRIEKELVPLWGERPIAEITRHDVVALIETIKKRPAQAYAHNIYQHISALFGWALEQNYGLEGSPTDRIRPSKLIGQKSIRTRVLSDDELRRLWAATGEIGYPFGPMVRMLMLTGCRVSEVAEARMREFDLPNRTWTIPRERFKSDSEHIVPLSDDLLKLLTALPPRTKGDHLFSTTEGAKPVNGFSKAKQKLDATMGGVSPFVLHDIRRTVRTRLSQLRIPDHVAEMVIGHARRGLGRIYDQHRYLDEIATALQAWAGLLRSIVEPTPPTRENVVVALAPERRARR